MKGKTMNYDYDESLTFAAAECIDAYLMGGKAAADKLHDSEAVRIANAFELDGRGQNDTHILISERIEELA
jgi:hypothetical protein